MNTSQTTHLSKPAAGERVPPDTFAYLRARAKRHAYDLVMKEFQKSGISKAELSRRMGKGADRVSRMLGGPGNWTLATLSDLLFAITGGVPKYTIDFPLDKPPRNYQPRDQFFSSKIVTDSSGAVSVPISVGSFTIHKR